MNKTNECQNSQTLLPIKGCRNILITSALPYVNNLPHLGNIIGSVLSADIFARYCRLRGHNTLYISGTDEYGTATEIKALEEKLTPQELCNKYFELHKQIYDWFDIQFDKFGRTSTSQQTEICQSIFWKIYENKFIFQDSIDQLYCGHCERFLADRFVEGICPFCNYEEARGDQCEKCAKLIHAPDLKRSKCKICSKNPVLKSSTHLFFDLSKLQPQLQTWFETFVEKKENHWTSSAKSIVNKWLKEDLKPRCITRDMQWGTPVPLEEFIKKVFYVWFDAPIGYLSITANYSKDWEKWWKNPEEVELFQFMAKDNVPFHGIIFPATMLATNLKWTFINHLISVDYLNYENTKFSKSRGVGVFGNDAQNTGIDSDIWRFYLAYIRPETQDSSFSWDDLMIKNNSELLNNLGNFINRTLTFLIQNFSGIIPAIELDVVDQELILALNQEINEFVTCMDRVKLRDGLRHILTIGRLGNQHIQSLTPWNLVKGSDDEKRRAGSIMGLCANIVALLSLLLSPYIPKTSKRLQKQLNFFKNDFKINEYVEMIHEGHQIGKPSPLFRKIEKTEIELLRTRFSCDSLEKEVKKEKKQKNKKKNEVKKNKDKEVKNENKESQPQQLTQNT